MYHAAGDSYPTAVLSSPELRQPIDAINGITVRPHRRSLFVCSVPRMSSPNPPCSFAADAELPGAFTRIFAGGAECCRQLQKHVPRDGLAEAGPLPAAQVVGLATLLSFLSIRRRSISDRYNRLLRGALGGNKRTEVEKFQEGVAEVIVLPSRMASRGKTN